MATCPRCGTRVKRSKHEEKYWCRRHGFVRSEDERRVKLAHGTLVPDEDSPLGSSADILDTQQQSVM